MRTIQLSYPFLPLTSTSDSLPDRPIVLAIGEFDGIHQAHQKVIQRAVKTARQLGMFSAIMTFHPHPREVLGHNRYAHYLTPLPEKLELFASLGVDYSFVVKFDLAFSKMTPEQFIHELLIPMKVNTVVVGFDFTFGYRGIGNPDSLCSLSKGLFAVEVVRPLFKNGNKVGSSLIREYLDAGNINEVNFLLGRPYSLQGKVVGGEQRGRTLGFPTANLEPSFAYVIPANGVYAVQLHIDNKRYLGVMNIGTKPTFDQSANNRTLEVHILDFADMIYGKELKADFLSFLRPERKFSSADELVRQIRLDIEQAKRCLLQSQNE